MDRGLSSKENKVLASPKRAILLCEDKDTNNCPFLLFIILNEVNDLGPRILQYYNPT